MPFFVLYHEQSKPLNQAMEKELATKAKAMMSELGLEGGVNLFCCPPDVIAEMNHRFRGVDKPTDILSFGAQDEDDFGPESGEKLIGELALCLEVAKSQAEENALEFFEELMRLIAHGLVHLKGMDHQSQADETAMLKLETSLLEKIGLGNIYG